MSKSLQALKHKTYTYTFKEILTILDIKGE